MCSIKFILNTYVVYYVHVYNLHAIIGCGKYLFMKK